MSDWLVDESVGWMSHRKAVSTIFVRPALFGIPEMCTVFRHMWGMVLVTAQHASN